MKIHTTFNDFRENGTAGAVYIQHEPDSDKVAGICNKCPGCGQESYLPVNNSGIPGPSWTLVKLGPLTLSPSILHKPCGWHGYIREGEWV